MTHTCKLTSLIKDDTCQIKYCTICGEVHLDLGNMTLYLTDTQFSQLSDAIYSAKCIKEGMTPSALSPSLALGAASKLLN